MDIIGNPIMKQLLERHSVRAFKDEGIDKNVVDALKLAVLRAPTAGCMTLYSIIEVNDKDKKEKLAVLCDHQPMIAKAPLVWVFLADIQRWVDYLHMGGSIERGKRLDRDYRDPGVGDFHLCMQDAVIAAQTAVVAADSLGLGSCYIGDIIENYEQLRELLDLPQYAAPAAMVIIGKPTDRKHLMLPRPAALHIFMEDGYHRMSLEEVSDCYGPLEAHRKKYSKLPFEDGNIADDFYLRKYTTEFMKEMNRSTKVFLDRWAGKAEE
ncbi:MAG: nitroreductase family protein [Spirochaetia bacterium]|nr:nitroreductase family protein [Spirochaetia bacterium]